MTALDPYAEIARALMPTTEADSFVRGARGQLHRRDRL